MVQLNIIAHAVLISFLVILVIAIVFVSLTKDGASKSDEEFTSNTEETTKKAKYVNPYIGLTFFYPQNGITVTTEGLTTTSTLPGIFDANATTTTVDNISMNPSFFVKKHFVDFLGKFLSYR